MKQIRIETLCKHTHIGIKNQVVAKANSFSAAKLLVALENSFPSFLATNFGWSLFNATKLQSNIQTLRLI